MTSADEEKTPYKFGGMLGMSFPVTEPLNAGACVTFKEGIHLIKSMDEHVATLVSVSTEPSLTEVATNELYQVGNWIVITDDMACFTPALWDEFVPGLEAAQKIAVGRG